MTTVILSPKGEITIPAELREKYGFNDWGQMSVIHMGAGSIFLKPDTSELDEIAKYAQETLEKDGITLDESNRRSTKVMIIQTSRIN